MLEDQVALLLQNYLGNYVKGLNKEALKISVWRGDVELKNMQLKPEALNALKLPVKVKAGFLGSVKLKVPWSRLGQDPVLVYLDHICVLVEPSTQVEGSSADAVQEAKKQRIREMEMKLLESTHQLKSEMNKSWLGSLINTIIGNLKLSITNIHIRYEDLESNPGHPFSAGVALAKLAAMTVDDSGKETFVTGGALERIQKSVELERLALYLDSDIFPWDVGKPWEDLLPSEWSQVFEFGSNEKNQAAYIEKQKHCYILKPVTGNARYSKRRPDECLSKSQPLQKAAVKLDDVTLSLSKDGYRDILKLADNFAAFNKRLRYAHYRPLVPVKSCPKSWWEYAYRAVSDELKKASGKLSWEQVLKYGSLRKKYITLYASFLKSDPSRMAVDDNPEIEELDRGLDIEVILQWRMLAHKFVEKSMESDPHLKEQKPKKSWWSFGWTGEPVKDESESFSFTDEDWEQLNKIIGYKEGDDKSLINNEKEDVLHSLLEVQIERNASRLVAKDQECLAELSCEGLDCSVKLYSEAKVFDLKLGSYRLSSPSGLLAQSAATYDSLVGIFYYKPFDAKVDWSMVAKASPCYMTYLRDSIEQITKFFDIGSAVSQTLALETAAAVQMTINDVKRTAQQQVNRALKDHSRFLLDLDIAAPKIMIPTSFCPENARATKLLLDLGKLMLRTEDKCETGSPVEMDMYLQFNLVLSDVSAFLVDGDFCWDQAPLNISDSDAKTNGINFMPVVDRCGIVLKLQQIRTEHPSYPSTRLAVRLPSLGFHFSPARYHRLMQVAKIFKSEDDNSNSLHPWNQSDFEGWLFLLVRKGVGNREAVWQRRYICLVGPFLYVLESPDARTYKQSLSLRGKQIYHIPPELAGNIEHVLAVCDAGRSNVKVMEDANAFIIRCDSDDSRKNWQSRLQGAIYRASGTALITSLSESSEEPGTEFVGNKSNVMDVLKESIFITGVLDELKICFSYPHQGNHGFTRVLLGEERRLFEFRAIGGQVELSIRANDMFIGTMLKSLEIEDLVCRDGMSKPCYLVRSFIKSADSQMLAEPSASDDIGKRYSEGEEKFFEASENLVDFFESSSKSSQNISGYPTSRSLLSSEKLLIRPPSFNHIAGLLPDEEVHARSVDMEHTDALDSFVKAQIVIYDQNSSLYKNVDKQVSVTLATLSFFCHRPTILAIVEFVNAINVEDDICEAFTDESPSSMIQHDSSREDLVDGQHSSTAQESVIKGLLGKGKSRVILYVTLNMARAQISLMNENGTKLATLSQNNLLTDIKVFPSSFSIKAALGNLKISDDSLPSSHLYYWACDMRNPGGSSFVELFFSSFSVDDEDYNGYDYSLLGQLSEVRIIYLNRFIQEVSSYFMGLVPKNQRGFVKLKDQVTNSEKWFTVSAVEGSPAVKLDLSLRKPIILMPRRTNSLDYLELDVVHITIQNTFQWFCGDKSELGAVHLEILTVGVEDINLTVGTGMELCESIIKDVKGLSVIIRRSLRDLLHKIPTMDAAIKIDELKAALSNREYRIIMECAVSNISETPNHVPPMPERPMSSSGDVSEPPFQQTSGSVDFEPHVGEPWINMKASVAISLVELCLHSGISRDAPLATVQVRGAWLLYKSNTMGEGFLSATLKGFTVIDDREGTEQEFRLAIGKNKSVGYSPLRADDGKQKTDDQNISLLGENDVDPVHTMLILDANFGRLSNSVSLCVQRPQLLVALDFLLAVVEFFVPSVSGMLSNEEDENPLNIVDAIILDQATYIQPSSEFSLSPKRPLVADDERFNHFTYDGNGGRFYLLDRQGNNLSHMSTEALIYVGSGKKLQFKNVIIKNGQYLDSCIMLGTNSSYSVSEGDNVFIERGNEGPLLNVSEERSNSEPADNIGASISTEFIIELQAIGPELTFYNTSKDVGESLVLSNKVLHAQLDAFCRLVLKGETIEMSANALGLSVESNGVRILEPFDATVKYSSTSGKTNIHLVVSDIFMNFSFSILRLFLAVEEDILSFLRRTSRKVTVLCSQFDKVGTIHSPYCEQTYVFWRPRAPPGFAILGDCLTPVNKPPTKGVIAVNISHVRVRRPVSFQLICPSSVAGDISRSEAVSRYIPLLASDDDHQDSTCSIWFPVPPQGYVALGCVVSTGRTEPPLSSAFCILSSLVSPCALRDCIIVNSKERYPVDLAFWRVDNSVGSFLLADPTSKALTGKAYDLRHIIFGFLEGSYRSPKNEGFQDVHSGHDHSLQSERSVSVNSGWHSEAIASFRLIWWNQGSSSRKKLSIWRPVVPQGMVYLGDIAVQGYEPPNMSIVLHDTGDDDLLKQPVDFQLVGKIDKRRGIENISFWLPHAPPGFVSLGCVACKGTLKQDEFSSLRCIRSDMVTGDQFQDESLWDTSDANLSSEPFSIWRVGNEVGTFIVRSGFRKPPKRVALKLADPNISSDSDHTVIDAEIRTFSAALFDDYGGLMVPLFNISLSGIGFSLHGRPGCLNSNVSFSLAARSYNDKYEAWEPLVEPVDGFLRYQYDTNAPGAASQLRLTSTKDLNLNISASNANMFFQAYASWNNLSHIHEYYEKTEAKVPAYDGKSILDIHQRRNYYIIPQNKLVQDIYLRATEIRGLQKIIRMPSGDMKPLKVPVSKNMLSSHLEGKLGQKHRTMVAIIIGDAQLPCVEELSTQQYSVSIRLLPSDSIPNGSLLTQQSARTCGSSSVCSLPSGFQLVNWGEVFFFKVDSLDFYVVELMVTEMGKGEPVGFFSSPLNQIARTIQDGSNSHDYGLSLIELSLVESMKTHQGDTCNQTHGRLRCSVLLCPLSEDYSSNNIIRDERRRGPIEISPTKEGPWTTVRLNYAARAACWRLGNDVVASEVSVKDGNRYVTIRSLVSVRNDTDFMLDICLKPKALSEGMISIKDGSKHSQKDVNDDLVGTDEYFETEKYNPVKGWVCCSNLANQDHSRQIGSPPEISGVELPSGWEWVDDWHVDNVSVNAADGWVYAPDHERLNWPESYNHSNFVNYARQRRWIRNRNQISGILQQQISVGQLKPGDTVPLPLSGLIHSGMYVLKLRPWNVNDTNEYSWSSVVDKDSQSFSGEPEEISEIFVSALTESEELLCCTHETGNSSNSAQSLWFCLSIKATEIAKDMLSNPIQDWSLVVKSPLSVINFLPFSAEFSVLLMQANNQFVPCCQGIFFPGKTAQVYNADVRKPLYFSLLPQGGWLPIHEAVLISHPSGVTSKTISLRSSFSGRIVQVILEQNHDKERELVAKVVRVYAPFWITIARCPPLTWRLLDIGAKMQRRMFSPPFHLKQNSEEVIEEITKEEIFEGYTIDSALKFKLMGLSVSISQSGEKKFGPVKDLSPLGDMDGSVDLYAYNDDGSCMRLFISSKPCPYQSVPTKVISVRPFMTFTNRLGQDIFVKLSNEDEPKVLHSYDSRVSFTSREAGGQEKIQVRLESTKWCFPFEITKEDTISLILREHNGDRKFLRTEIRGYEEGSRFIVVFRLGSIDGPIRVENRTMTKKISIRQSGLGDDAWIHLSPLSTTNFSWEDPYGQRTIDTEIHYGSITSIPKFNMEKGGLCSANEGVPGLHFHVIEIGDIKVATFFDDSTSDSNSHEKCEVLASIDNWSTSHVQNHAAPLELIIELGVFGVSVIDHRPREISFLYLESVFFSYSTGYDGGTTNRFKLIFGHLQLDNQLPLTVMPVVLAPEQTTGMHHPVFKMTITMRNENLDGTLVYPYVYIRVTENCWRLRIHEPVIWALVDLYNNLQIDRIPKSSTITQVDPEIRVDLIDISEIRLKLHLETDPTQRPHGVLGIWSPILSAVGNAFKIQVHLRKVMHRNRYMRKSSVVPAIVNRIWRDLIHNPLHLLFSVDVLGMTSSTLASLSKGFADLSTDGQFLQLRSKQMWSRRITGVSDGFLQGTEALAQGVAFGVSGVLTKPVESTRQHGLLGLAHGLGRAFLGFIVQPMSGALDFFSLTVDGIGASCSRCLEVFSSKATFQRIRNPRAIHVDGIIREYCEREAVGQMVLYLAEASRHFGCTDIFREPSKFAWSDYYEDHFVAPHQRIALITNKRVMLLQCLDLEKMDKKPSKIMWDVPWEELMALELAKAGYSQPSLVILHLKNFKRSKNFIQLIKCNVEGDTEGEPQAVRICSVIRRVWKAHQSDMRSLVLKVPSSQRHVYFGSDEADGRNLQNQIKPIIKPGDSFSCVSGERKFLEHTINFQKIWSSERELKSRCTLCQEQGLEGSGISSIWRPVCPYGYVSIGDIARVGNHPPNVAAVYHTRDGHFALPVGYDLVWRNCSDDYKTPASIWLPRAPEGFVSLGCVAVAGFAEPQPNSVYCVVESLAEETSFEEQEVWSALDSYPWACHFYQARSDALHFVALRQPKEKSNFKPMRVIHEHQQPEPAES